MKTLLTKVAVLLAPFIVAALIAVSHAGTLREGVFDGNMQAKFLTFLAPDTEVVIAGDSRAECQIVPSIVESRTGLKTCNVASGAGDLITLYNALKRNSALRTDRALIVSTSIFQVNDGAIQPGYISTACILNMTWPERIEVYRLAFPSLLRFLVKTGWEGEGRPGLISVGVRQANGFVGHEGRLLLPVNVLLDPENTNHFWYRNPSLHGARWRIFREALGELAKSKLRIYIYLPPVSPAWRDYTAGTFIDSAEREFGEMLRAETLAHSNIRLLDYYSEPDRRLGNDMYFDIQHLNSAGAAQFTEILMARIGNELRARGMRLVP
jgi:hypothetical protein